HLRLSCKKEFSTEPRWPILDRENAPRMVRIVSPFADLYGGPSARCLIETKLVFGTWAMKLKTVRKPEGEYIQVLLPGGPQAGDGWGEGQTGYIYAEAAAKAKDLPAFNGKVAAA